MIVVKASVVVDDEQQDTAQAGAASPMPSSPAPDQPQKSAPPKKGRVANPFRLFLISLIVIGVVVMLAQRKQVAGTPAPAPNSEADIAPVDTNPTESSALKPPSGGHIF